MYAHVKDGGVVDYMGCLPKSWGSVSNLHLSEGDDAYLKTLNWFPLVETNATPAANQTFNKDIVTVEADRVLLIHSVRDMTAAEIVERDACNMQHLRELRDKALVDSDWTQAPDHSSPLADAQKDECTAYRQFLRDLPATADMRSWPSVWRTPPDVLLPKE